MAPIREHTNPIIALVSVDEENAAIIGSIGFGNYSFRSFANGMALADAWNREQLTIAAIISQGNILGLNGISLYEILNKDKTEKIPFFIIIDTEVEQHIMRLALASGITDVFKMPLRSKDLATRIGFLLVHYKEMAVRHRATREKQYKTPPGKRIFDIFFSGLALLLLSPLFLIVILLLKLESKGPVFYYSLRVGTGYKVFKFYKFRSMYVNADRHLKDLKGLNQYANATGETTATAATENLSLCDECLSLGTQCRFPLYADNNEWCEKQYHLSGKGKGSAFFKLKNDPRITKVGKVLRNTSIDELPQLLNVLKGDMSIVGNRPLPLYEAEKLTTDKYSLRFLAPAGITGLWQVEKRGGKGEMSEEERLLLDNVYAKNHSFFNDIRIILKTIPALFQKENV